MPIRKRNPGTVDDTAPGFGDEVSETPDSETLDGTEMESFEIPNGMPEDLIDDLFANGVQKEYTHTLYKVSDGTGKTKKGKLELCSKLENRYPDPDEIGSEYGSGEFKRYVSWRDTDKDGKAIPRLKIVSLSIGGHYDAVAAKKRIEQNREIATMSAPNNGMQVSEGLNMVAQIMAMVPKSSDNGIGAIVPLMVQSMQSQTQMMMLAFQQMREDSNNQMRLLMETMKTEKKSTAETLAEYKAISELFTPQAEKPSMLEQAMEHGKDLLIAYAPIIGEAVSKLNNPLLAPIAKRKLTENEEFQALLNNPEGKAALIEHVYNTTPVDKADTALLKAGIITQEQTRAGKS